MSDPDEEFENCVIVISNGKGYFSDNEQNIIDSWLEKLAESQETDEKKAIRNKYANTLARQVDVDKQLFFPFTEVPPDGDLISISKRKQRGSFNVRIPPCKPKSSQGTRPTIPKIRRNTETLPSIEHYTANDFEDPEEMAIAIAQSKVQSFAEFIISISRHTADFGQGLRRAMNIETLNFREYVDSILTQRIKDLTEVLNEEQSRELQKIKKDIDKWQVELAHLKRRIEEMIPEFDLDQYKKDKNYLKKMFTIKPELTEDESFKKWKEETCIRLKWINDKICKVTRCKEQTMQELSNIKCETANLEAKEASKKQTYMTQINCEMSEYQNLQLEREKLFKENNDLLCQLKGLGK